MAFSLSLQTLPYTKYDCVYSEPKFQSMAYSYKWVDIKICID